MPDEDEVSFLLRIHNSYMHRQFQLLAYHFSASDVWADPFGTAPFPILDERGMKLLKRFVSTVNVPLAVVVDKDMVIRFIRSGTFNDLEPALREAINEVLLSTENIGYRK